MRNQKGQQVMWTRQKGLWWLQPKFIAIQPAVWRLCFCGKPWRHQSLWLVWGEIAVFSWVVKPYMDVWARGLRIRSWSPASCEGNRWEQSKTIILMIKENFRWIPGIKSRIAFEKPVMGIGQHFMREELCFYDTIQEHRGRESTQLIWKE